MADSAEVDEAVIGRLVGDATLSSLMPDGVYFGVAKKSATRFVVVEQLTHDDNYMLGGEAYERFEYLVKAVEKNLSGLNVDNAAARIQTLLQDAPLTVTGYTLMRIQRTERVRYTEPDADNADARWQHSGGRFEAYVSPA